MSPSFFFTLGLFFRARITLFFPSIHPCQLRAEYIDVRSRPFHGPCKSPIRLLLLLIHSRKTPFSSTFIFRAAGVHHFPPPPLPEQRSPLPIVVFGWQWKSPFCPFFFLARLFDFPPLRMLVLHLLTLPSVFDISFFKVVHPT